MRWWVRSRALELGLSGHAANLADGRVEIVLEGPPPACARMLELLAPSGGAEPSSAAGLRRPGSIRTMTHRESAPRGVPAGFVER